MPKGGKREGSGAKLRSSSSTIVRGIRFTQEEWNIILIKSVNYKSPSEYIRQVALGVTERERMVELLEKYTTLEMAIEEFETW